MKTNKLMLSIGAAVLTAITLNATAGQVYLSPRAAGDQIKHVSGIANDPNLINTADIPGPAPRATDYQARTVGSSLTRPVPW